MNNQLKVNVDEEQNDIKDLKEQCNKDDKDKNQIISDAGTPMKKNTYVCVKCNWNLYKELVEKSYHGRAHDQVSGYFYLVCILVDQWLPEKLGQSCFGLQLK